MAGDPEAHTEEGGPAARTDGQGMDSGGTRPIAENTRSWAAATKARLAQIRLPPSLQLRHPGSHARTRSPQYTHGSTA